MNARDDRIAGVLVGLAAGDALDAGYEFGPAFEGPVEMKGGGPFGWEPAEWTDDTQMAICIAEQAATGDLDVGAIGDRFIAWSREANDIGKQTGAVLARARSGVDLPGIAADRYREHPRSSAGNGSLMRTGPVALPHLEQPDLIAESAAAISALTHADPLAIDACVLWSVGAGEAVATGEIPEIRIGLEYLRPERRDPWVEIIHEAGTRSPRVFTPNGFVVTAFQAAWSSIGQTPVPTDRPADHLRATLENTVRIGYDTDTVAAIAGTLLGGVWGASAVPDRWRAAMHGWPGYTTSDLVRLARAASGAAPAVDWPDLYQYRHRPLSRGDTNGHRHTGRPVSDRRRLIPRHICPARAVRHFRDRLFGSGVEFGIGTSTGRRVLAAVSARWCDWIGDHTCSTTTP